MSSAPRPPAVSWSTGKRLRATVDRRRRLMMAGAGLAFGAIVILGFAVQEPLPDGTSGTAFIHHPFLFGSMLVLTTVAMWFLSRLARLTQDAADAGTFLNDVLDALPSATAVVGSDGRVQHVNAAWTAFLEATTGRTRCDDPEGYTACCPPFAPAADGHPVQTDDVSAATDGLRSVFAGDWDRFESEYAWQGIDGSSRWYHLQAVTTRPGDRQVVISHTDVTAQRRADEALRRESGHARTIASVAARISASGVDLDAVADTVTHELSLHIGELATFFTFDEERRVLHSPTISGRDVAVAALGRKLLAGTELHLDEDRPITRAAREGRTSVVTLPSIQFLFDQAGVPEAAKESRSIERMLHVPVIDRERTLGVISVIRLDPIDFTADEIRLVEEVATRAGFALSNVRLFAERDRAEAELRASEELFRVAFDDAPFGMALIGPDQRYRSINRAFGELLGYDREDEIVGRFISSSAHPDDIAGTIDEITALMAGTVDRIDFEIRALRRDGTAVWVRVNSSLVRTAEGEPAYFVSQVEDRTEAHLRAERDELRRHQAEILARLADDFSGLFGEALDHAVGGLVDALVATVGDTAAVHVVQDRAGLPMVQASRHRDPEADAMLRAVMADQPAHGRHGLIARVLETGEALVIPDLGATGILDEARPDAHELLTRFPVASVAALPLVIDGAVDGVLIVGRSPESAPLSGIDISFLEEVAARASLLISKARLYSALRNSESLFRIAFHDAPHGIALVAPDGRCLHANEALCAMVGRTSTEILGSSLPDLIHPDDLPAAAKHFEQALADGIDGFAFEVRLVARGNQTVWTDVRTALVRDSDGSPRYFVVHLANTTEARRNQRLLDVFFANSPDLMAIADDGGNILRANPSWEDTLGWALEGATGPELLDRIHPDDREASRNEFRRMLSEDDGGTDFVTRMRTSTGRYRWVDWRNTPLLDEGLVIINARDETVLRQQTAELNRQRLELARSNDDLQRFAHTVSHDLKAPLRVIAGFSDLLASDLPEEVLTDDTRNYLDVITSSARRMDEMIAALLRYARVGGDAAPFEPVDLGTVIADSRAVLAADLKESDAELITGALPVVQGDPSQLRQLFENLIGNAVKYRGPDRLRIHIEALSGPDCWHVVVRDNGIGVDPAQADRIFEIFRRLAPDRPGAGVGLAICERIVHRHQGSIWVEPNPDGGSSFHVTLPAGAPPPSPTGSAPRT